MWHWGYFGFPLFGFFLFTFFALMLVVRLLAFRRCHRWHDGWYGGRFDDAEAVLRRRLVSGEISEEDYQRLKDILRK